MRSLQSLLLSGKDVLPLIEGGKGVSISTGLTAGRWALAGGVGTFSGVNADFYDDQGHLCAPIYRGKTRRERHEELIAQAIKGGITQAQIAHEESRGQGRLHMNVLWEMGGAQEVLRGVLEKARSLIHGITCGAGMPYKLAEIASHYGVFYAPIISSARAFRALWKRSYSKFSQWLSAVVYEDPWRAGGHNGLSNQEDPLAPQDPYGRVLELRQTMVALGLDTIPIIMAGGVWCLREWQEWIESAALGPIAFQFGTRPLLTQESPLSDSWKKKLLSLKEGDILLNTLSPTGFYSSAIMNDFLKDLVDRSERQVSYAREASEERPVMLSLGARQRSFYVAETDAPRVAQWILEGYGAALPTPDGTLIFVNQEQSQSILQDQRNCMGCLSACRFSNWHQDKGSTGLKPDPRSFCIQKTLQEVSHGGNVEKNLLFAGHNAYRFAQDPFYANGFIPTVAQLVERIQTGD